MQTPPKFANSSVPNSKEPIVTVDATLTDLNPSIKEIQPKVDDDNDYIWLKIAEKGTFGTVYKVKEIASGRIFAIKKVYQDPHYVNTEHQIVKELDHVNCIKVYKGYYTTDKQTNKIFLNIVMDYFSTTLYYITYLYKKRDLKFPLPLGKIYAYQIMRALLYLESKSIVHRDLKPKNVLINPKNHQVILADFGSAKIMQSDTLSISYICTRHYRAPELLLGDETYRSMIDMWAAGCVIAEMFLKVPLFQGKNTSDQLLQIIKVLGTPSKDFIDALLKKKDINLPVCRGLSLSKKLVDVDPLIQDLIYKALNYDPVMRITPLEALMHPCFDELRAQEILINGCETVDLFDFTLPEVNNDREIFAKLVPEWYTKRNNPN